MKRLSIAITSLLMAASASTIAATEPPLNQQQPLEKIAPYPQAEKGMSRRSFSSSHKKTKAASKLNC